MNFEFGYPNLNGRTEREQISQLNSYIRQLVEYLQYTFSNINGADNSIAQSVNANATACEVGEMRRVVADAGIWQYKKWSGGNYDMSAEIKITPQESNPFSSGAAYYSEQIRVDLPFAVETIQYVGVPSAQGLWLMDAVLVDANRIGFRLASFETIKPSEVVIRLLAQGKTKNT